VAFLVCGAAVTTLFFSASVGKLQMYVLPVVPILAVGLGAALASKDETPRGLRLAASVLAGALLIAAVVLPVFGAAPLREAQARGPGLLVALSVVVVGWAAALIVAARSGRTVHVVAAVAAGAAAVFLALVPAAATEVPNHTFAPLAAAIRPGLDAGAELIADRGLMQSASFYTGRRVALFEECGETEFGLSQLDPAERAKWYSEDFRDLRARMSGDAPVYCVVRDHERALQLVARLGGRAQEIIWNRRRSIVGNAAAAALTPPVPGGLLADRRRALR
jgi:hypothetical protein